MRTSGVVCLALGIVMLIFSAFPFLLAENALQRNLGLGCAVILALPLIVVGTILVRHAEKALEAAPTVEASEALLNQASRAHQVLSDSHAEQPQQQTVNWKAASLLLGLMAVIGGAILLYGYVNKRRIDGATAAHQQLINTVLSRPAPTAKAQPPKGTRRLVLIDTETKKVDWAFFDLPDSMQAKNSDEADLAVLLSWDKRMVSQYANGKPGYQWAVRVRVIDPKGNAVVAETELLGGPPPGSIKSSDNMGLGSYPRQQVVDYLTTLWR